MTTVETITNAHIKMVRSHDLTQWTLDNMLAIISYSPEVGQAFNEMLQTLPARERTQLVWALTCVAFKDAKRNEPFWANVKPDMPTAYLQLYPHEPALEQSETHSTAS
jgi:hypothetical protein